MPWCSVTSIHSAAYLKIAFNQLYVKNIVFVVHNIGKQNHILTKTAQMLKG